MNENKIRKQNLNFLNSIEVKIEVELPLIELKNGIRSKIDIENRINLLHIFYTISLEGVKSIRFFKKYIQKEGWEKYLIRQEQHTLKSQKLTKQDKINYSWYKESLYALLWCSGIVGNKRLENFSEIDISDFYHLIPPEKPFHEYTQSVAVRDYSDIYTELDLYFLLHWYVKNQINKGKKIFKIFQKEEKFNESVIIERRRALEWVLDNSTPWDEISLDT